MEMCPKCQTSALVWIRTQYQCATAGFKIIKFVKGGKKKANLSEQPIENFSEKGHLYCHDYKVTGIGFVSRTGQTAYEETN